MKRNTDENAWNAHLAVAVGKSYVFIGSSRFLKPYFALMDELRPETYSALLHFQDLRRFLAGNHGQDSSMRMRTLL